MLRSQPGRNARHERSEYRPRTMMADFRSAGRRSGVLGWAFAAPRTVAQGTEPLREAVGVDDGEDLVSARPPGPQTDIGGADPEGAGPGATHRLGGLAVDGRRRDQDDQRGPVRSFVAAAHPGTPGARPHPDRNSDGRRISWGRTPLRHASLCRSAGPP